MASFTLSRVAPLVGLLSIATLMVLFVSTVPSYARAECAVVSRVAGQSILVNTCGECRSIQVVKDRSGNALPSMRTFVLNPGERFPLPFKGPGGTRVTNDAPCREYSSAEKQKEREVAEANQRCVFPMQTDRGIVLVNGCSTCRSVVVERRYMDGRQIHKSYSMNSKDVLAFSDEGAVTAEIIHDVVCNL